MSSDEFEFEDMGEFEVIDEVGEDEDSDYSGQRLSDTDLLNDEDIIEEAEAFLKNELVDANGKANKDKLNVNDNSLTTEKAGPDTTKGEKSARKVADCLIVDVPFTVENVKSQTESDSTNKKNIVTRPGKSEIEAIDEKLVKCDQVLEIKDLKDDVKEVDKPNLKNKHEDDDYDDDDYDDDGSEEPGSKKERKKTDVNPFIYIEYTKQIEQKVVDLNTKFERLEGLMTKCSSQNGQLIKYRKRKNDGALCTVEKFKQCPPDERYSNRCRLYIGIDAETKEPAVGFQSGFGLVKRISEVKHDFSDHLVEAVKVFEKAVKASTVAPGEPSEKTRIWNIVIIHTNSSQDLMILVLLNNPGESSTDDLQTLKAELKEFFQNGEGKKCRVISLFTKVTKKFRHEIMSANKEELILRNPYLEETVMGFKLWLTPSPVKFGCSNYATEIICKGVEELLSPTRRNSILMLGCNISGLIGFCLSKIAREVAFVDSESRIEETMKNAERNKITNCHFISGDHEVAVRKACRKLRCAEAYAVISSGCKRTLISNMVINKLRQMETLKKIVLVTELSNSCYNVILALSNRNYRIYDPFFPVRAIPVDSMPNTERYVVLILMERIEPSSSSSCVSRDVSRSSDRKVPLPPTQYDRNPRDTLPDRYEHQMHQQKYDIKLDMEKIHVDRGRERFFGNDRLRDPLTFEERKLTGDERRLMEVEKRKRHVEEGQQRRQYDTEKRRRFEEQDRRQLDDERHRKRPDSRQRRRSEERQRKHLEEDRRKRRLEEQQQKRKLEEEQRKKQLEEEQRKKQLEEEQFKKRLEEEWKKKQLEEEQQRKRLEEERQKRLLEEEEQKRQLEEEQKKRRLEEARKKLRLEKERKKRQMEEEEKKKRLEEERKKMLLEKERQRKIEEEQQKKRLEEEEKRKHLEEEERKRRLKEEEQKRQLEEARKKLQMEEAQKRRQLEEERKQMNSRNKDDDAVQNLLSHTLKEVGIPEISADTVQKLQHVIAEAIKNSGVIDNQDVDIRRIPEQYFQHADYDERGSGHKQGPQYGKKIDPQPLLELKLEKPCELVEGRDFSRRPTQLSNPSAAYNYVRYEHLVKSSKQDSANKYARNEWEQPVTSAYDRNASNIGDYGPYWNKKSSDLNNRFENSNFSSKNSYDQNQLSDTTQETQLNPANSKYSFKNYDKNPLSNTSQGMQKDSYNQNQLSNTSQETQSSSTNSKYNFKDSYNQNLADTSPGMQLNPANSKYSYKDSYDQNQLSGTSQGAQFSSANSKYSYKNSYDRNQLSDANQGSQLNPTNSKYNYKDLYEQNQLSNTSQEAKLNPLSSKYNYKDSYDQNQLPTTSQGAHLNPFSSKYNYKNSYDQNQTPTTSQGAQLNPLSSKYNYKDSYDQNQLLTTSQGAQLNPLSSKYNYKDSYDQNKLPTTSQGAQLNPTNSKYGNKNSYDQTPMTSQVNPDLRFNYKTGSYNYNHNPVSSVRQSMTDDRFSYKNPYRENPSSTSSQITSESRFSYMKDSLTRTVEDNYSKRNPYNIDSASFHSWKDPVPALSNSQRSSFQGYWKMEKDPMGPERK